MSDITNFPLASAIVVMCGAPCSGKGTQCQRIARATGAIHISTGDLFRDAVQRGTELGVRVKEHLERNEFVPDNVVTEFVMERLLHPDIATKGCLLDGFPRTADQAKTLLRTHGGRLTPLLLDVPEAVLPIRAAGREINKNTGEIYHTDFLPPPPNTPTFHRDGDRNKAAFKKRIAVFRDQLRRTLPLLPNVKRIAGAQEPEEVSKAVMRALADASAGAAAAAAAIAAAGASEGGGDSEKGPGTCVVCCDRPANFLVTPCGHQCGCEECLCKVKESSGCCPICRVRIASLQKVFRVAGPDDSPPSATGAVSRASTTDVAFHMDVDDLIDFGSMPMQERMDEEWEEWPAFDASAEAGEEEEKITLLVSPEKDVPANGASSVNVCVRIAVPEVKAREPVDIACVIDTSGSMANKATREDEQGRVVEDGLSILDIVKHAVKTVIHTLGDVDRLSLIGFSDNAFVALPQTLMDAEGKELAVCALENMQADDCTNIWAGVHAGMESLRDDGTPRRKALLLLTDGMPNIKPPKGEVEELKTYFEQNPKFASALRMSTFGFGYKLDSKLLLELAEAAKGTTAFIPDAVITGTVFVNAIANVLSVHTPAATLHLTPKHDATFAGPVLGGMPVVDTSWGRVVDLGPLQSGQTRDVVVPLSIAEHAKGAYLEASLTATNPCSGEQACLATVLASHRGGTAWAVLGTMRARAVTVTRACIVDGERGNGQKATADMARLCGDLKAALNTLQRLPTGDEGAAQQREELAAMLGDVQGRMTKALKGKPRFDRWGRHYLRAIMRAHQLQVCTNFMDGGLQSYGGQLFASLREKGDKTFLSLPPPKPQQQRAAVSRARSLASQSSPAQRPRARSPSPPAPDMSTYYAGSGGGCFHADAIVQRALMAPASGPEGTGMILQVDPVTGTVASEAVRMADVRAGDRLQTADGGWNAVTCVVKVTRSASKAMVLLPGRGGLVITPRHPVRINGTWTLPCEVAGAREVFPGAHTVYTVLLAAHRHMGAVPCHVGGGADRVQMPVGPGGVQVETERAHGPGTLAAGRAGSASGSGMSHVLLVGGVECITWGHGLSDPAIAHPFFGTDKVERALACMDGYAQGEVCVKGCLRSGPSDCDPVVGLISQASATASLSPRAWPGPASGSDCAGPAVACH
eukprot:CAMPEP_0181339008 /NCGR_PEP_ID=MMETSP1101-20121128/28978_1 /TAXON_ID=46948 /ORGANISM="Rhodomonas abbreviata, Strain Caron Lab Isolate" /LENGTH=1151 /DNA_ID=CAMNT_0023449851 /DNA_START=145 /DNA_END=3600 /DNA_ORIENTATION=+